VGLKVKLQSAGFRLIVGEGVKNDRVYVVFMGTLAVSLKRQHWQVDPLVSPQLRRPNSRKSGDVAVLPVFARPDRANLGTGFLGFSLERLASGLSIHAVAWYNRCGD
jgi:hypothetical protein